MSTITAYAGGATDKQVILQAYTASTGVPYTAGAFDTSGLAIRYRRAGATSAVTITPVTQTISGAHTDGGFVHIAGGAYRVDIPDAAIAASADYVHVWAYGISDVTFSSAHIDILGADPRAANVTLADGGLTAAKFGASAITSTVLADNAITAAKIAADAITDAKVASDVTIASVTGAVGSVTGNVGGNVVGSVGSVATGGIAAASFAANAVNAAALAADAVTEIQSGLATAAALTTVDNEIAVIDGLVDDIKAKTDSLTFTNAGLVDSTALRIGNSDTLEIGGNAPSSPIGEVAP